MPILTALLCGAVWEPSALKYKLPSAGEMMVGSKTVFFMDEISTGLDSSTTYAIVKFLRDQTHALNYTTMISLLQPAPESYDLFDDILLLAEGTLQGLGLGFGFEVKVHIWVV